MFLLFVSFVFDVVFFAFLAVVFPVFLFVWLCVTLWWYRAFCRNDLFFERYVYYFVVYIVY